MEYIAKVENVVPGLQNTNVALDLLLDGVQFKFWWHHNFRLRKVVQGSRC